MELILYTTSLAIIAFSCLLGVLSTNFEDNLIQRIGFSLACIGASTRLLEVADYFPNETNARYLFTYGVAIVSIGTVIKFWKSRTGSKTIVQSTSDTKPI